MKLIYAIIRYDNEDDVTTSLTKHKFSVTRLSTTGGFLKKGNTTLMIVTEAERVDEAVDIIKKECGHHQKITGDLHIKFTHAAQIAYILLRNRSDGNIINIYFITLDKVQEQIQRTFERSQLQR